MVTTVPELPVGHSWWAQTKRLWGIEVKKDWTLMEDGFCVESILWLKEAFGLVWWGENRNQERGSEGINQTNTILFIYLFIYILNWILYTRKKEDKAFNFRWLTRKQGQPFLFYFFLFIGERFQDFRFFSSFQISNCTSLKELTYHILIIIHYGNNHLLHFILIC